MSPIDPEYINHRERETALFEARARGEVPHRRKGGPMETPKQRLFQQDGATPMLNVAETIETPHVQPPARPRRVRVPANLMVNGEPATAPTSLLDVILHAGSDPAFDVAKFRALVEIQREEQDRADARADREAELAAEAAFNAAMADVQQQMVRVRATMENRQTNSVYADYAAMDRMLRPLYSAAGFGLTYGEEDSPKPDHVRVFCLVTHVGKGGAARRSYTRRYHVDMPADGKGARGGDVMTKTHATQSAFTYGQRGLLRLIFNIAVSKDDDGNAAGAKPAVQTAEQPPGTISASQAAEIRKLLEERAIAPRAFLNFIRLPSIEHIGVEHFDRAIAKIKSFGRN